MDRINFNHLYYFYITAKAGSIKGASETLFVTQPTISDQIKLLEEHLECKLFIRKHRSLYLSDNGEIALKYAEKIFSMGNELTSRLRNQISGPKKTLDIGITNYMSHFFLYKKILPLFEQDDVSVNIKESEKHLLVADLEEEKIDLMFTINKDGLGSSLSTFKVGTNKSFAVAHKKYKKYIKGFPESLNEIPFFNYTDQSFLKYEIELFFTKNGLSPKVIGEADDLDLFDMVTENGLAFTIVPEVTMNRMILNNDVIVLGEIEELQTSVWGVIKTGYKGLGYQLLKGKL
jgi:LysR family transcriptional activator of nhaA